MLRTDLPEIITETLPGPKAQAIIDRREAVNPSAIKCIYPVVIEKGEGAMIQDVDGNKFLDWIGGVGVLNIGFSHPEVVEAVKAQAEKYFHGMYNVVTHEGYVALSEKLAQIAPVKGDKKKVFFANSGAEADTIAAIVVEPLQGEGGFIPAPIEWVNAVRKICDENGILLVADEVQTGFCRTGRMFATNYWEESGVQPDILATAKSIAAGVPLSAIVAREEIMEASAPGTIGGTFCGNALACAAALKTIEIMERDNIAGRSCEIGEKVSKRFNEWKEKYPVIGDVRGLGGMIGLEFVKDQKTKEPYPEFSAAVIKGCAQKGLMIEGAGTYGNVIRFLAPLVMTDEQLEAGLDIYESVIKELLEK